MKMVVALAVMLVATPAQSQSLAQVAAPVAAPAETGATEIIVRRPARTGPLRITALEKPRPAYFGSEELRLWYRVDNAAGATRIALKLRQGLESQRTAMTEVPATGLRQAESSALVDATENRWAGQDVRAQIEVTDARGRTATSKSFTVTLPQRFFLHPLARDIGRLRTALITRDITAPDAQAQIADLSLFGQASAVDTTVLAALRQIYWRLGTGGDASDVIELMWLVANDLEGLRRLNVNDMAKKLDRTLSERDIPLPSRP